MSLPPVCTNWDVVANTEKCQPAEDGKTKDTERPCFGTTFLHTPPTIGSPMYPDGFLHTKLHCIESSLWELHKKGSYADFVLHLVSYSATKMAACSLHLQSIQMTAYTFS